MRDMFPGYFRKSEQELQKLWKECIFVFDTNVLVNLYRYSKNTKKELLSVLENLKTRMWMPNRVAEEYLRNRARAIGEGEEEYNKALKAIKKMTTDYNMIFEAKNRHPYVSNVLMRNVNRVFAKVEKELNENKDLVTKQLSKDEIQSKLVELFNGNIGEPYNQDMMKNLIEEGKDRYKQKVPPGFADSNKHGDTEVFTETCQKYGDLIIWKQIIDKSSESGKGIIFVTGDTKEDWWQIVNKKIIGPLPELVKEFEEKTKNVFYMYTADHFLSLTKENLEISSSVSEETVNEVREVNKAQREETIRDLNEDHIIQLFYNQHSFPKTLQSEYANLVEKMSQVKMNIEKVTRDIDDLLARKLTIDQELGIVEQKDPKLSGSTKSEYDIYKNKSELLYQDKMLEHELKMKKQQLQQLEFEFYSLKGTADGLAGYYKSKEE